MIGAVVLAAGSSTRMGSQKLLLPWDGRPLIRHVVESVLRGPIETVVVVTGHSRAEVETALAGLPIQFAHNADYERGMLSSVRAGVAALPDALAPMIVLGDQPALPLPVITALVDALREDPEAIAVPVSSGRRGHPMAFAAGYRNEVLSEFDDVGLRGLLRKHAERVREIAVDTPEILIDLDTPEDYRAALAALRADSC